MDKSGVHGRALSGLSHLGGPWPKGNRVNIFLSDGCQCLMDKDKLSGYNTFRIPGMRISLPSRQCI